ncbi:unnamed protein product [Vitrella brassicaformis CCMP3155]|uniref:Coilin N-terminal domain-containing protein n=2 Tax=Vitrella brassicaformis TaxID=1169539 RepID=A0A0G4FRY4_VITBC|nr:unnamed protein product [Vitrella brassicaformis CCMP3155]|eukprot:CEM16866.1 unnamed protein product [Vitrella brassicaformis CCMP3155]
MRLKVEMDDASVALDATEEPLRRSLVLVSDNITNIGELISHLQGQFGFLAAPRVPYLSLDGFTLPPSQPLGILRDTDVVRVHLVGQQRDPAAAAASARTDEQETMVATAPPLAQPIHPVKFEPQTHDNGQAERSIDRAPLPPPDAVASKRPCDEHVDAKGAATGESRHKRVRRRRRRKKEDHGEAGVAAEVLLDETMPAETSTEIKAGDLISVARLTEPIDPGVRDVSSIAPDPSQRQPYIGQERVGDILRKLVGRYEANDGDHVVRVEPMVITRFSRGGKTRLMKQIGAGLHTQGIPALFITFNEQTTPTDFELSACSPLQSISLRIAWATATPEALEKVAQALKKPVAELTFDDWVRTVSVSHRTIKEWLGSGPLVLFVDELNQRIPSNTVFEEEPLALELADFVLQHFLNKRQRYFVFSSQVAALGNSLLRYYSRFGFRGVYKLQIPRVERISAVTESGICSGTHAGIVSWTGRVPGLLTLMYSNEPPQPNNVRQPFKAMEAPRLDADLARAVIQTAIEGDGKLLGRLGTWSRFLDVFGYSCVWPPCYLGLACDELGKAPEVKKALGKGFATGLRLIPTLLDQLLDERESGKRWEGVAVAEVLLRLLYIDDGCKFGGVITASQPETLKALITEFHQKMDPTLAGERYVSYFVKPIDSTLHGFSFFVFVTEYGSLTTIYGGQCKERPTGSDKDFIIIKHSVSEAVASLAPDEGDPEAINASARVYFRGIWLCGDDDQGQEVNINKRSERDIGVVPSRAAIEEVIGVSLAQMCPFEWLVEGKDQAGGEGTGA